ncbi:hypothetical protein DYE50_03135 [Treponema ruminis]|nr:hypothetical protein DYE50_03135 [Treponema ruminis]
MNQAFSACSTFLSFLSFTDMPFKELSARRLLSAGENEYITHYFFCQHFFEFFFHFFFCFFSSIFHRL